MDFHLKWRMGSGNFSITNRLLTILKRRLLADLTHTAVGTIILLLFHYAQFQN
jgi:hypothetical protein